MTLSIFFPNTLVWSVVTAALVLPATGADRFPRTLEPVVVQVGKLPKEDLQEASGVVRSRHYEGLFWTHNDGSSHQLIGINREGTVQSRHPVAGVFLWDWEDIADDEAGRLYLADTGNNLGTRMSLAVYRMPEPDPARDGIPVSVEKQWRLRFPGKPFDCEALFVWKDHGYLISKTERDKKARLYRWPLVGSQSWVELEELGKLRVEDPVTGSDLTWDGSQLGLVTTRGALVATLGAGGPVSAAGRKFHFTEFRKGQIEGCAFVEDGLLAVAESQEIFLFTDPAFVPVN